MISKKRLAAYVLVSVLTIIAVPLLIDWFIIGNNVPSHISNSDWVGFLGGYIGAILGAVVSLVGIVITIRYTSSENRKDRQLEIRPYCLVNRVKLQEIRTESEKAEIAFQYDPEGNVKHDSIQMKETILCIGIENVGVGPALDWRIEQKKTCSYDSSKSEQDIGYGAILTSNCIQCKEWVYLVLHVYYMPWEGDKEQDWRGEDGLPGFDLFKLYPTCHLSYSLSYSDMIGTRYQQEFGVVVNFSAVFSNKGKMYDNVNCDVRLENMSTPRVML